MLTLRRSVGEVVGQPGGPEMVPISNEQITWLGGGHKPSHFEWQYQRRRPEPAGRLLAHRERPGDTELPFDAIAVGTRDSPSGPRHLAASERLCALLPNSRSAEHGSTFQKRAAPLQGRPA